MNPNQRHPLNYREPEIERKFNISAYIGKGCNVYLSSEGGGITKELMFNAFQQVAALFGWELTGQLINK